MFFVGHPLAMCGITPASLSLNSLAQFNRPGFSTVGPLRQALAISQTLHLLARSLSLEEVSSAQHSRSIFLRPTVKIISYSSHKSLETLLGSTGHAPRFVGQPNESPVLTRLAKDTVKDYLTIPGGFETVGGLELSSTPSGLETLERRQNSTGGWSTRFSLQTRPLLLPRTSLTPTQLSIVCIPHLMEPQMQAS